MADLILLYLEKWRHTEPEAIIPVYKKLDLKKLERIELSRLQKYFFANNLKKNARDNKIFR